MKEDNNLKVVSIVIHFILFNNKIFIFSGCERKLR